MRGHDFPFGDALVWGTRSPPGGRSSKLQARSLGGWESQQPAGSFPEALEASLPTQLPTFFLTPATRGRNPCPISVSESRERNRKIQFSGFRSAVGRMGNGGTLPGEGHQAGCSSPSLNVPACVSRSHGSHTPGAGWHHRTYVFSPFLQGGLALLHGPRGWELAEVPDLD